MTATCLGCSSSSRKNAAAPPTVSGPVRLLALDGPFSTGPHWGPFAATSLSGLEVKIRKAQGETPLRCARECWADAPVEPDDVLVAVRYGNDSATYLTRVDSTIRANVVSVDLSVALDHCAAACSVPEASDALFAVPTTLLPLGTITVRVNGIGTTTLTL